jgi:pyruvate-formate lyase-activating enzyme
MKNLINATSTTLRRIAATLLIGRAKVCRQGFVCDSLQGTGPIGVCINSDLMLSCGYRDLDGSGRLGDLRNRSFEDVFLGPGAESFRTQLSTGRLPTLNCAGCTHLRAVAQSEAKRQLVHKAMPTSVMMENTSACNLDCLSCQRDTVKQLRRRRAMSLDDVRTLASAFERMGVKVITYHHLGEPFLSKHLLDELHIIRDRNPGIRLQVSTNGMLIDTDQKREAALLFDHIQFSLDGINQDMASRYQRGLEFKRALQNLGDLVTYRDARNRIQPRIVWKYLLFRWNEHEAYLSRAIELAREMRVDEVWFEKTVSPLHGLPWRSHLGLRRDYAKHFILREDSRFGD